jgi:uncharacterized membrane protein
MQAKARFLGHPIHQILIVLPLGLLVTAVVFDLVAAIGGNPVWDNIAYWLIGAGVIGGLLAAPFGLIDWLAVPGATRAKRVGAIHGIGNVVVVVIFAWSWLLRRPNPMAPSGLAHALAYIGFIIAGVTGWLGGELVTRLGVGVDPNAHVDAPSSLSSRTAGV